MDSWFFRWRNKMIMSNHKPLTMKGRFIAMLICFVCGIVGLLTGGVVIVCVGVLIFGLYLAITYIIDVIKIIRRKR